MAEVTIESLQAEVAKRDARLKKAVQVFNEQKADITRLTNERDSYKSQVIEREDRIKTLEATLQEKSNDDAKFFDQVAEIDGLNEKLAAAEQTNAELATDNHDLSTHIDELEGQLNVSKNNNASLTAELEATKGEVATLKKVITDRMSDLKSIVDVVVKTANEVGKSADSVKKQYDKIVKTSEK